MTLSRNALVFVLALACCAPPQKAAKSKPRYTDGSYIGVPRALKVVPAKATSAAIAGYLQKINDRLAVHWNRGVRTLLDTWLPDKHPINTPGLAVELTFRLNGHGQPHPARVLRSSGIPAFDNAALKVILQVRNLPKLPPTLAERQVTLRWVFFRQEPGTSASYAHLSSKPLPAAQLMEWALARANWTRAAEILRAQGAADGVRYALAAAGLETGNETLEDLSLDLAPGFQLAGLLRERGTSIPRWNAALDALLRRKDRQQLSAVVGDYAGATLIPLSPKERRERGRRLLALLHATRKAGAAPPPGALARALRSPQPDLASAAAALVKDRRLLAKAFAKERRLRVRAVIGAQLARKGHRGAVRLLKGLLAGKAQQRRLAFDALHGKPVEKLIPQVGAVALSDSTPLKLRIKGLELLGSWNRGTRFLYRALRSDNSTLKMAAIAALTHSKSKLSASYRLAEVAYKDPKHAAAALKALVRIGHPRFTKDVMWLTSRLSAADQAVVAPSLPVYGNEALTRLKRMLRSSNPRLKVAALRALRRIKTPEAQKAVAAAGEISAKDDLTAPQPDAKGQKGDQASKRAQNLAPLLREALRLAKGGAPAPVAPKPDAKAGANQHSSKAAVAKR